MRTLLPALFLASACSEYDLTVYEVVDVFLQDPPDEVDILLVIDNSGSMLGYQLLVGARFDEFLTYFEDADVDYHIGVVTTTVEEVYPHQGCPQDAIDAIPEPGHLYQGTFITPETPDPAEVFSDLTRVGACGSGDEQGLEAAARALSPELLTTANNGFIRPEASLSLIFVSDEEDASPAPVHHYVEAFYGAKPGRERGVINASALVVSDLEDCIVPAAGSSEGDRYVAVAEQTEGVVGNLCNTNFADIVTELSLNASRLRDTFFLSQTPSLDSLSVYVDGELRPCEDGGYTYELVEHRGELEPALVFERLAMPRPEQQITARYNSGRGEPEDFCPAPQGLEEAR